MVGVRDEELHAYERRNRDWSCKYQAVGRRVRESIDLDKLMHIMAINLTG